MNYKKGLPLLFFPLQWIFICIGTGYLSYFFGKGDTEQFFYQNSYYSGYHFYPTVETVHTVIYLYFLMGTMPKINNIRLVRTGKNKFIFQCYIANILSSAFFSFFCIFTNIVGNFLLVDFTILQEKHFLIGSILDFTNLFIYYSLVGSIYFLIWVATKFSTASQWICTIFLGGSVLIYIMFNWNIQLLHLDILNDIYKHNIVHIDFILSLVKNIFIYLLINLLTIRLFQKEDILCKYEI